jgi:hypothetical protein
MFRVNSAICCDFARSEAAGKYYCLGIYPKNIIAISDFSIPIGLSFYIDISSDVAMEVDTQFLLENRATGHIFLNVNGKLALNGYASAPLVGGPYTITVGQPSTINFSAITGGRRIELCTVDIVANAGAG